MSNTFYIYESEKETYYVSENKAKDHDFIKKNLDKLVFFYGTAKAEYNKFTNTYFFRDNTNLKMVEPGIYKRVFTA